MRPKQRARILARDGGTSVICHRYGSHLVVAHLISVYEGHKFGLLDRDLFSDDHLAAMCEECNAGFGKESLPLWVIAATILARRARRESTTDDGPADRVGA